MIQSEKYFKRLLVEHKESHLQRSIRVIKKEVFLKSQQVSQDKDDESMSDILSSSPHERIRTSIKRMSNGIDKKKNLIISAIGNHILKEASKVQNQYTPLNKHIQKENE